jgi:hypothetical protein
VKPGLRRAAHKLRVKFAAHILHGAVVQARVGEELNELTVDWQLFAGGGHKSVIQQELSREGKLGAKAVQCRCHDEFKSYGVHDLPGGQQLNKVEVELLGKLKAYSTIIRGSVL